MRNAIDPLVQGISGQITCHYVNSTSKLQIVRIENVANWYFERVVFPGQHLVFQALSEAVLEVHTSEMATTILADRIPCTTLRYTEVLEPLPPYYVSHSDGDASQADDETSQSKTVDEIGF
ncbi:MAG: DUF1830 domain-containing protein [Cyanobacteria bacterium P01_F01_bin.150]